MFALVRSSVAGRSWLFAMLMGAALSGCGSGGGGSAAPDSTQPPPTSGQPTPPTPPAPPVPQTPPNQPIGEPLNITASSGLGNYVIEGGNTVTLSVTVSGTGPISYQWYRDGAPIEGATQNSYTSPALSVAESGVQFHVIVSNSTGHVTSTVATVGVNHPFILPTITQEPITQTVDAGQSATFSVSATSPTPLTYQWRLHGDDIEGATGASYTTPPLTVGPTRWYSVVVRNSSGATYSASALAIVQPVPPQVIAQPIDPEVQSYLVAFGSLSESAGDQTVPATGNATVTVSSHERVDELPVEYEATLQLNQLDLYQIYAGHFSTPQHSLSLTRHVQGTVAGLELERYDGVLPVTSGSSYLGMDILIARDSDFDVGIGNWKRIGGEQYGYFSGIPAARGSFILGDPTDDAEIQDVSSGTYEGFSHGGLEFDLSFIYGFEEFSSAAHVTYDATTHELTLTLDGFQTYEGALNTGNLSSNWPVFTPGPTNALNAGAALSCVVTIDPSTNEFSCTLSYGGSEPAGTFKGKFYGPEGNEIAGTFALTGLIRYSLDDAMVGAVAVKRVP